MTPRAFRSLIYCLVYVALIHCHVLVFNSPTLGEHHSPGLRDKSACVQDCTRARLEMMRVNTDMHNSVSALHYVANDSSSKVCHVSGVLNEVWLISCIHSPQMRDSMHLFIKYIENDPQQASNVWLICVPVYKFKVFFRVNISNDFSKSVVEVFFRSERKVVWFLNQIGRERDVGSGFYQLCNFCASKRLHISFLVMHLVELSKDLIMVVQLCTFLNVFSITSSYGFQQTDLNKWFS